MPEPHPHGGRGSSEVSINNHEHDSIHPNVTQAGAASNAVHLSASAVSPATNRSDCVPLTNSPMSPPASPSLSCPENAPRANHTVDTLAHQLRNQSLVPQIGHSISTSSNPPLTLSPASLPDNDAAPSSVPHRNCTTDMEIDSSDDNMKTPPIAHGCVNDSSRDGLGITVPTLSSSYSSHSLHPPSTTTQASTLDAQPEGSSQALTDGHTRTDCSVIEVDEGYCEEEDDFTWVGSVVSRRDSMALGGAKTRYGLEYRTSSEAASRCKNAIHCVPRMRRRDKKRRRRMQNDMSMSGMTAVTTQ